MSFSPKIKSYYAKNLIRLAWSVEIIAVLIGLTISIVVSVSASSSYSAQGSSGILGNSSSVLVAGLPFLLVAMVELCKIPLTFAFMAVKNIFWRALFLFFVFFLCVITFETMLNGFERNFSNLNYAIDSRKNDIENINVEMELLKRRQQRVQLFTEPELTEEINAIQKEISQTFQAHNKRINNKTDSLLADIDYSFEDEVEVEISRLLDKRDNYYEAWNKERLLIEDRFSALLLNNLSDSRTEKQRLLTELEELKTEMKQKLADASFLTRNNVDRKYRGLIANKNSQLDQITTGYLGGDALVKQAAMEDQLKQQVAFTNSKYEGRIAEINERIESKKQDAIYQQQMNAKLKNDLVSGAEISRSRYFKMKLGQEKELNNYHDNKQQQLIGINAQVVEIEDQMFLLSNDQRNIQSEINQLINQNQVYRMAMYAFGKESPSDVDRQMVGIVALLWFGSLALVASVTGVMLCLAGFYLRYQLIKEEAQEAEKLAALAQADTVGHVSAHLVTARVNPSQDNPEELEKAS